MNRTIKFKRYFQHDETGRIAVKMWGKINFKGETCEDNSSFISPATISGYGIIADCQFSGLLDKNGKEIYDGDLLKGGMFLSYEVKWDYEECGWNINHDSRVFEVIGNIYENPELLEK